MSAVLSSTLKCIGFIMLCASTMVGVLGCSFDECIRYGVIPAFLCEIKPLNSVLSKLGTALDEFSYHTQRFTEALVPQELLCCSRFVMFLPFPIIKKATITRRYERNPP